MFRCANSAFLLLVLSHFCFAQVEIAGCKAYEPAQVSLHGILIEKAFPGSPNYKSVHEGDAPESIWLVKLDSSICVNEDKDEPDLKPSQKNVKRVQLVIDK